MINEELRARLDGEAWDAHLERLALYAQRLIRERYWRGVLNGPVPGGKTAEDFASEAICAIYSGTRRWNPETHPDILRFLLAVVKSEVSNAVTSRGNQDFLVDPTRPEAGRDDDNTVLEILDYVKDDPELGRYVEAIFDGYEDRAAIADHLGIKPTDVDNLRKKMKRRLDAYYKERNDHGK